MGLASRRVYLLILGTTAVTLVVTPLVMRTIPQVFNWVETIPWLKQFLGSAVKLQGVAEEMLVSNHIIVSGYGQVGQNIVRLLQDFLLLFIGQVIVAMQTT